MTKAVYEPPMLTQVGTFETITKGGSVPGQLDADFPEGTDFDDLTFS